MIWRFTIRLKDIDALQNRVTNVRATPPPLTHHVGGDGDLLVAFDRVFEDLPHPKPAPLERDQGPGIKRDVGHAALLDLDFLGRCSASISAEDADVRAGPPSF